MFRNGRLLLLLLTIFLTGFSGSSQVQSGKVFWRGMVDDRIRLAIRGDQIFTTVVSGSPQPEGVYSFTSPLPEEPVTVSVLKKAGRGKDVKVIQQPNADNQFAAIVEIYDNGGGAREYQLEISWE